MSLRRTILRVAAAPVCAALACLAPAGAATAARLDPALHASTDTAPLRSVVTFHGEGPPEAADLALLSARGVHARPLKALPMAVVEAPAGQLRELALLPRVRSIWHDRAMHGIASGPAHPALPHEGSWSGRGIGILLATPGAASGDGVHSIAPGAEVVGFRTGSGTSLSTALGAFDHALGHQFEHNIRVLWNPLAVLDEPVRENPDHPLQVALRALAERGVLVVVPRAGDSRGSAVPWAITAASPDQDTVPALCGVLALMLEANPALDWRQAREILGDHGDALDPDAAARAALARSGVAGRGQAGPLSSFGAQVR